jgi:hypothetical protein
VPVKQLGGWVWKAAYETIPVWFPVWPFLQVASSRRHPIKDERMIRIRALFQSLNLGSSPIPAQTPSSGWLWVTISLGAAMEGVLPSELHMWG